ncbi:MAG: cytochrome c maturation protein CcmE [Bacillota bacterium]
MKKQTKVYLGVTFILAAIGFLIFSAMQGTTMYYMTVDEALAVQGQQLDKAIRMKGKIVHASVSSDIRQPLLRFQVQGESGGAIWIEFKGVKPDNMLEAIDAIVEGRFNSQGVFIADSLLMTCPSKYESGEPTGKLETIVVPKAK